MNKLVKLITTLGVSALLIFNGVTSTNLNAFAAAPAFCSTPENFECTGSDPDWIVNVTGNAEITARASYSISVVMNGDYTLTVRAEQGASLGIHSISNPGVSEPKGKIVFAGATDGTTSPIYLENGSGIKEYVVDSGATLNIMDMSSPSGINDASKFTNNGTVHTNGNTTISIPEIINNGAIDGNGTVNGTITGTGSVGSGLNVNDPNEPSSPSQPSPGSSNSSSSSSSVLTANDPNGLTPSLISAYKPTWIVASFQTHKGITLEAGSEDYVSKLGNTPGVRATADGIELPQEYNGMDLSVIVYSDPKYAGSNIVENGKLSVDLSSNTGNHNYIVVDNDSRIVAKTSNYIGANVNEAKVANTGSTAGFGFALFVLVSAISAIAIHKQRKSYF